MTKDEKEFLNHIFNILGYDTSDGAPPVHEQFYERHKEDIEGKRTIPFKDMTQEEKRKKWRDYNRLRQEKLWEERKKRK